MDSILTSTKELLGMTEEYKHYDSQIIMHINGVFLELNQIGVGPARPFVIHDDSATWNDFASDIDLIEMVKPYMGLKVQMAFDPPTASQVAEAKQRVINEYVWRLNVAAESGKNVSDEDLHDLTPEQIDSLIDMIPD